MTGQELYEKYTASLLLRQNCTTDSWSELDESDKEVWDDVASGLTRK